MNIAPSNIRVAESFCDLSSANWSNMVQYGTAPVQGAIHQALPNTNNKMIILPSIVNSCSNTSSNPPKESPTAQLNSDPNIGEHIGPTRSNQISPVRIKLLSNSGQRIITGVFQAVTLVYRRVDLPFSPPSPPVIEHSEGPGSDLSLLQPYAMPSNIWNQGVSPQLNSHVPFSNMFLKSVTNSVNKGKFILNKMLYFKSTLRSSNPSDYSFYYSILNN